MPERKFLYVLFPNSATFVPEELSCLFRRLMWNHRYLNDFSSTIWFTSEQFGIHPKEIRFANLFYKISLPEGDRAVEGYQGVLRE